MDDFTTEFAPQQQEGLHNPLVTIRRQTNLHFIYVEHLPGMMRLASRSDASTMTQEIAEPGTKPVGIRVTYSPESGKLTTAIDGREILVHEIGTLVTAPAQVTVGRFTDRKCHVGQASACGGL